MAWNKERKVIPAQKPNGLTMKHAVKISSPKLAQKFWEVQFLRLSSSVDLKKIHKNTLEKKDKLYLVQRLELKADYQNSLMLNDILAKILIDNQCHKIGDAG